MARSQGPILNRSSALTGAATLTVSSRFLRSVGPASCADGHRRLIAAHSYCDRRLAKDFYRTACTVSSAAIVAHLSGRAVLVQRSRVAIIELTVGT